MAYENHPWHAEHAAELSKYSKSRYKELRSKGICVYCGERPATERLSKGKGRLVKYCAQCRSRMNLANSKKRLETKIEVLAHYSPNGILKCSWSEGCEIVDPDMLSVDHINNNGNVDRKSGIAALRGGMTFYRRLRKEGFPDGYQTLCHNHQWKKEILRRREGINILPSWRQAYE